MKKKTTTAILLATTMMLALMGCGAASADTDSSSDAASVTEVDTDNDSDTDTTSETTADTSSDSVSSDSADTATASADATFTYKGETFSILDDLQTTLDKIDAVGKPSAGYPIERDDGSKIYSYDETKHDSDFFLNTYIYNGTVSIGQLTLMGPNAKTSKGIGSGSTVEELTSAYGDPVDKDTSGTFYNYEFDKYTISFDTRDNKVFAIYYFSSDFYNSRVK